MTEYSDLISDFSQKADFKSFYNNHRNYYNTLIKNYKQLCDLKQMQAWLEKKFTTRVQSYRIIFSPLTGGFHNTIKLSDKSKNTQAIMFVNSPKEDLSKLSSKELEFELALQSRLVFTEIDHNYVGPVTNKYLKELITAMPDYKVWNQRSESNYYSSSEATFDEYMTWSVFCLFAMETYSKELAEAIIQKTEDQMIEREFIWFQGFNREMIKLYIQNCRPQISELYLRIMEWMKNSH
jgi:hypothetical protein